MMYTFQIVAFVQVLVPLPQIPQCRALYDFQLDEEMEKDCLTFKKVFKVVCVCVCVSKKD